MPINHKIVRLIGVPLLRTAGQLGLRGCISTGLLRTRPMRALLQLSLHGPEIGPSDDPLVHERCDQGANGWTDPEDPLHMRD